jgi:tRNA U34 5-methylaminomethyl-2-thiouridine-forming methyltransferase MnmC
MDIELLATDNGSHTIRNKLLKVTYHSKHGAIKEKRHNYIEAGLHHVLKQIGISEFLNILEIGFGTGLNAVLTLKEVLEKNRKLIR